MALLSFRLSNISHCLCFDTVSAQVWHYSALFFQTHFVWPLTHFCGVCVHLCGIERGDASLPLQSPLRQIGLKCEWGGEEAPQSVSFHQSWQLLLLHITRSHFYRHTSQPMSSHLHSPAFKLYCSVCTNVAYQQWWFFFQLAMEFEK